MSYELKLNLELPSDAYGPQLEIAHGTFLNQAKEPAQAGEEARYLVDSVQTEEGRLANVAVPLVAPYPVMRADSTGLVLSPKAA